MARETSHINGKVFSFVAREIAQYAQRILDLESYRIQQRPPQQAGSGRITQDHCRYVNAARENQLNLITR